VQYTAYPVLYVGPYSFTIFLFYNKIVKLYMVDGSWTVVVGT